MQSLSPLAPSAAPPSPAVERFIARRWERWGPWTIVAMTAATAAVDFRERHRQRCLKLLALDITPRELTQLHWEYAIDDPRPDDAAWSQRVAQYLINRSRKKGIRA
jgi:hypothetical protein